MIQKRIKKNFEENELTNLHKFVSSIYRRDGLSCFNCSKSKESLMKNGDLLIPTNIRESEFNKNVYRTGIMEYENTRMLCRDCHNKI